MHMPGKSGTEGDRMRRRKARTLLEDANRQYAALRMDPVAWQKLLDERAAMEGTLPDGLSPDEIWTEDGRVVRKPPASGA